MKRDCNELDNNLLDKVQDHSDEQRQKDDAGTAFPIPGALVTVGMMVPHCGKKRHIYGEPPEEERGRDLEHSSHIFPFLAAIGEDASNGTNNVRQAFCNNLEIVR
jgi:hypothetical protein